MPIQQKKASNGVKDRFYGLDSKYIQMDKAINPHPAHYLSNQVGYIRKMWIGKLPVLSRSLIELCKESRTFPCIYNMETDSTGRRLSTYPWEIGLNEQRIIDAALLSIHLPVGTSSHYEVRNTFFKSTTILKFSTKLRMLTALMPLFVYLSGMVTEYKIFFMMYSEDISSIFSPVLSTKEISILQDKLTEDVCLYQGLFPPPMHLMVFHLLIHCFRYMSNSFQLILQHR